MQRRDNLAYFILASVVVWGLPLLMVDAEAQGQIAFTSERDGNREIYVMDADKGWEQSKPRRLTNSGNVHIHNWNPSWSPDSEHIAFTSNRDGNLEIYVMDADGRNQRRLTNSDDAHIHNSKPSWSPDGKRIAFTSGRDEGKSDIYVMDADGGNPRNLTNKFHHDRNPSWSPDGKRIAFMSHRDRNWEIFVMDADGGNPRNFTNNPRNDTDPAWYNPAFAVTPAGKKFTIWGWLKQVNR